MYTASEAAHVISACEDCLKKEGVHVEPFIVDEIREDLLKEFLTDSDYLAPFKVIYIFFNFAPFCMRDYIHFLTDPHEQTTVLLITLLNFLRPRPGFLPAMTRQWHWRSSSRCRKRTTWGKSWNLVSTSYDPVMIFLKKVYFFFCPFFSKQFIIHCLLFRSHRYGGTIQVPGGGWKSKIWWAKTPQAETHKLVWDALQVE